MKLLVTGSDGFLGKNVCVRLSEIVGIEVLCFSRKNREDELHGLISQSDFVVHLAGVNRPDDPSDFFKGNAGLTELLCQAVSDTGRKIPIIYASSIQAESESQYGKSKKAAEDALLSLAESNGSPVHIFRLPNVFGKWSRPNYNSVVATFCHNISRDLNIWVSDESDVVTLAYVDDVVAQFVSVINRDSVGAAFVDVDTTYRITLGELVSTLKSFRDSRDNLTIDSVGVGLARKLYSTYISYLGPSNFSYAVPQYGDSRGIFVEMLKTKDSGQFSFFTAHPGVTRGGHYHHTKTEKFLVIKGEARFCFRNLATDEFYELFASGKDSIIVETIPGWAHDITNVGVEELVVMLWANEIFDRDNPDTYSFPLSCAALD
jgi:UDP-2-acetamido-2,6-beta-L-arabino-hexul-4-ose reductase